MRDPRANPARVGVIGLGFMGSTHVRCYQSAAAASHPCTLAAVADHNPAKLTGLAPVAGNIATVTPERLFDPALVRAYSDPLALIADPDIDAVSICTHTLTHVDLAIAALSAGKHVLVEKPIALDAASAHRLLDHAAYHPHLVCMPAMVMRFWPGWSLIRDAIRAGAHGGLRALTLTRRGSTPAWSPDFYANTARTGGALFDLHVHDADFILWTLGPPDSVGSTGDARHVTTLYRYNTRPLNPLHVVAEGGTDHDPAYGFHIRLTAAFQHATIDFDLGRTPNLMLFQGGVSQAVPVPTEGPFDLEIRAFIAAAHAAVHAAVHAGGLAARSGKPTAPVTQPVPLREAVDAIRLLEAEQQSLQNHHEVALT